MKHRRKNKTKIKVSKQDRIQSADDLQFNACVNLVSQVLIHTYSTYKRQYVYCHNNKQRFKDVWNEIDQYEKYKEDKVIYLSCKYKKKKYEDDLKIIKDFEARPKIFRPKRSHYDFYWRYLTNRQELDDCIWFYHSERYRIFCLSNYIDGDYVMEQARNEIKGELK